MNHIKRSLSLVLLLLAAILAMAFPALAIDNNCTNLVKFSPKQGAFYPTEVTITWASGGSTNLGWEEIARGTTRDFSPNDQITITYPSCSGTPTNYTGTDGRNPIYGWKGFRHTNTVVEVQSAQWYANKDKCTYKVTQCWCTGNPSPCLYFSRLTYACTQQNIVEPGDEEMFSAEELLDETQWFDSEQPELIPPAEDAVIIDATGKVLKLDAYQEWWKVNNGYE